MGESVRRGENEPKIAAELVCGIGGGDLSAETALVERYRLGLLFLLRRKTRGDDELAQDLCQETFRVAIEKLRQSGLEDPEKLAGYLYGIANHLWLGDVRKNIRRATTPDPKKIDFAPDEQPTPLSVISRQEIAGIVRQLLGELNIERDRQILQRFYVDEEDKEVICEELHLDSLHFNRVLFRAKKRFKALVIRAERKRNLRLVE